jgi:predicted RND superfamily exporter protein
LKDSVQLADYIRLVASTLMPANATWAYELTGIAAFLPLIQNSMEKDFAIMDGIALPIAVLTLGFILKSVRLLILPLLAMGVSALVSFMVMYFCTFLMGMHSLRSSFLQLLTC